MAWTGQQWEEKRNEFDEYGKVNQHLGFDLVCMINPDEITIPLYLASDDKNGKKKDEKKDKKKKFFWIIDVLGYVAFCQNLVFANRSTHVINKTTADGAWAYLLLLKYREWDPNELTRRYGEGHELEEKQRLLSEALEQRNGDAAKEFWKKQAARQGSSGRDREDEATNKYTEAMEAMELGESEDEGMELGENEDEGDLGEAPMDLDD